MPTNIAILDFIREIKKDNFKGTNFIEYNDGGGEIYISFQVLLRFLDEYVNLNYTEIKPIINIDWKNDKPFFAFSTTVSCNLLKCYLYNDYLGTTDGAITDKDVAKFHSFTYFNEENSSNIINLQKNYKTDSGIPQSDTEKAIFPTIGNINYIYLNAGYIAEMLVKDSDNAENKLSVQKFLQNICDDVNKSLGSINDFQVIIDDDENYVTIVDFNQKRIKGLADVSNNPLTTIKAQGLGSFVTSINAQSSITPEIATMISVGAQKDGNVLGEEATSLSRLSAGLTDRLYPVKFIANTLKNSDEAIIKDRFQDTVKAYKEIIYNQLEVQEPKEYGGRISYKSDNRTNIENIPVELYKACLGKFTTTNQTSTTFIPIKLDFSLSGISGIKVFQKFNLSNDVLPYIYNNNFSFIVTGVSHEVNNNNIWSTKISSLITIKDDDVDKVNATSISIGDISQPVSTSTSGTGNSAYVNPSPDLIAIAINAGYAKDTTEHVLSVAIGTQEGWSKAANGGIGTKSYRNNNPGNLDYQDSFKSIDKNVALENNPFDNDRFAQFTTAEQGIQSLVEYKIKRWAKGDMPITVGNQTQIPTNEKYIKGSKPSIAQFIYTYAPPSDNNNTENYIKTILTSLKSKFPNVTRSTLVNDLLSTSTSSPITITTSTKSPAIGELSLGTPPNTTKTEGKFLWQK
jgi:hypothetical protein